MRGGEWQRVQTSECGEEAGPSGGTGKKAVGYDTGEFVCGEFTVQVWVAAATHGVARQRIHV